MANIYNEEENMKEKRLSDYINNVLKEEGLEPKKKLTFDEWYAYHYTWEKSEHKEFCRRIWQTAQENV